MICRHCGTEIADKALICYRCGAAATDPVRKPAEIRTRRSGLFSLVVMVLLVLLGLFLGQAGRTMTDARGSWLEMMAGICLVAALALLLARVLRRR